ncbi:hypothetical protein AB6O49_12350 [Streptomyces sp. SBR177]
MRTTPRWAVRSRPTSTARPSPSWPPVTRSHSPRCRWSSHHSRDAAVRGTREWSTAPSFS